MVHVEFVDSVNELYLDVDYWDDQQKWKDIELEDIGLIIQEKYQLEWINNQAHYSNKYYVIP